MLILAKSSLGSSTFTISPQVNDTSLSTSIQHSNCSRLIEESWGNNPRLHPSTTTVQVLVIMADSEAQSSKTHFKFEAIDGLFFDYAQQAKENPGVIATTLPSLGLLDTALKLAITGEAALTSKKPWQALRAYVDQLNKQSPDSTSYKVLYLTRHGEGFHNAAHARFGTEAWDVRAPKDPSILIKGR